jgi:hypothetical protein
MTWSHLISVEDLFKKVSDKIAKEKKFLEVNTVEDDYQWAKLDGMIEIQKMIEALRK